MFALNDFNSISLLDQVKDTMYCFVSCKVYTEKKFT